MTVALYVRVSTDEQATEGFGLEVQKDRLIAYCKSQGWDDYEVYSDDGYSGTTLERPALKRLIRHVERGLLKTVLVYRLDRLSRRQRDCLYLLEEVFEANGVAFRSATESFDTSTPYGKAMLGILAVFAQLERETIVERTKEGRYRRAREGLWTGGPQPFGYRWDKDNERLVIMPSEAYVVKEIFRRFLAGYSLSSIAEWAASRTGERWWDHHVVKTMLQRELYAGYICYGKERAKGSHEPIVDEETFERAQRELRMRVSGTRRQGMYLLSGILRCAECGEPMQHHATGNHHYYVCARKNAGSRYYKGGKPCPSRHIPMHKLEDDVVAVVRRIAMDPAAHLKRLQNTESAQDVAERVRALEAQLTNINKRLKRWYDAYDEGGIDLRVLRERVNALEQERLQVEDLLEEAKKEAALTSESSKTVAALRRLNDVWDKVTFDERRELLRAIIHRIYVLANGSFTVDWQLR